MKVFKKTTLQKAVILAITAAGIAACGDNNSSNETTEAKAKAVIEFTPANLDPLGEDYDYEGWLITPDGAKATGPFDIDADDKTKVLEFEVEKADADAASKFVLTIEPAGETGEDATNPSKVHIIAGDIMNSTAIATTADPAAIGTNFSAAAAKYILATPSNGNATPTQGIWYIDQGMAGLNLPELSSGWVYEGWIVDNGKPMSTGAFTTGNQADSDGAGEAAGPSATPAFPGQDYVDPALDLVGKTAVISVEPDPDNSDAPFSLKPLVGTLTNEAGQMMLENTAMPESLPSAMISIMDK